MKTNTLQERIDARVKALGISAITLAKSVGLERGYINDLLIGRKKSVRGDKLSLVAKALDCDPDYLTGEQDVPRRVNPNEVPFLGICETGVWRSPEAANANNGRTVPAAPDQRYPGLQNCAFEVRGGGLAAEGIIDGMTVTGVDCRQWVTTIGPVRTGMIVVARAAAENGNIELSLRRAQVTPSKVILHARPGDAATVFPPIEVGENVEIVAVVTRAFRLFLDLETALTE